MGIWTLTLEQTKELHELDQAESYLTPTGLTLKDAHGWKLQRWYKTGNERTCTG